MTVTRGEGRAAIGLVFALTAAAFAPALAAGFVTIDDPQMVLDNPGVTHGLSLASLRWAFTTWYWGMWHPLTWVSHQLDVSLFGLAPLGHHAVSVLLHALTTALAFAFFRDATKQPARALLVALLFGLHPLRAESVVWIAERKDVLCTLFSVAALFCHGRYRASPSLGRYLTVTAMVVLSLLAKPTAVTLPFVLLLADFWPLTPPSGAKQWRARVVEKLPWILLSAGAALLTVLYQRSVKAEVPAPLVERLARVPVAYALNLAHTVWPSQLSFLYPRFTPAPLTVALSVLLLTGLLVSAWVLRRRAPSWTVGVLWFLGTTLPTAGVIQVGWQITADRYTYLPHLGLFAGLVFAVPPIAERFRRAVTIACAGLVAVSTVLLWGQIRAWSDSERLYRQALARDDDNAFALHLLALIESDEGDDADALPLFARAVQASPHDGLMRANYAWTLLRTGALDAAVTQAELGYRIAPDELGVVQTFAKVMMAADRCADALPAMKVLFAHPPAKTLIELDYSSCLIKTGQSELAWPVLERGLSRLPQDQTFPVEAARLAHDAGRDDLRDRFLEQARRRGVASH